jgi:hypothetical protein
MRPAASPAIEITTTIPGGQSRPLVTADEKEMDG